MPRLRPLLRRAECVCDHEEGQLADERRSLDVRDELRRRDEPAVRQDATNQRLGGARRPGGEVEDRLVDDEELVLLERRLDVADDAGVDAAAEQHRLVDRVALRRVHLPVGTREQIHGRRAVVREDGPADAPVDLDGRAVDAKRPAQRIAQTPDERARTLVAPGSHREDDELVAADARDRVRLAHDRLEAPRERLEHARRLRGDRGRRSRP